MAKVSIIIPSFNRAHCLDQAVESLLNQTYKNLEILVIDDGSTDNTQDVLKKYDRKIRCFAQANQGVSVARNRGISEANGEYITFLDSDDYFEDTNIEKKVTFLERHPDIKWVYSDCRYIDKEGNYIDKASDRYNYFERKKTGMIFGELLHHRNFIATDTVTVKKDALNSAGGFDERIFSLEDYDLWLRISAKYPAGYINEALVYVTDSTDSLSNDLTKWVNGNALITDKIKDICPEGFSISKSFMNRLHADKYNFFSQAYSYEGRIEKAVFACLKSIKFYPFQKMVYLRLFMLSAGYLKNCIRISPGIKKANTRK